MIKINNNVTKCQKSGIAKLSSGIPKVMKKSYKNYSV